MKRIDKAAHTELYPFLADDAADRETHGAYHITVLHSPQPSDRRIFVIGMALGPDEARQLIGALETAIVVDSQNSTQPEVSRS